MRFIYRYFSGLLILSFSVCLSSCSGVRSNCRNNFALRTYAFTTVAFCSAHNLVEFPLCTHDMTLHCHNLYALMHVFTLYYSTSGCNNEQIVQKFPSLRHAHAEARSRETIELGTIYTWHAIEKGRKKRKIQILSRYCTAISKCCEAKKVDLLLMFMH